MHRIERIHSEPNRGDYCEPVARWEDEGGAWKEREQISPRPAPERLTTQMDTGESMNEAPSP